MISATYGWRMERASTTGNTDVGAALIEESRAGSGEIIWSESLVETLNI